MTITAVATATPQPLSHTFWCQPERCVDFAGESVIHRHLIGSVLGTEVTVERIDDYDANDQPRKGRVEVYVRSLGEAGMNDRHCDQLNTLVNAAKLFAAEVA